MVGKPGRTKTHDFSVLQLGGCRDEASKASFVVENIISNSVGNMIPYPKGVLHSEPSHSHSWVLWSNKAQ